VICASSVSTPGSPSNRNHFLLSVQLPEPWVNQLPGFHLCTHPTKCSLQIEELPLVPQQSVPIPLKPIISTTIYQHSFFYLYTKAPSLIITNSKFMYQWWLREVEWSLTLCYGIQKFLFHLVLQKYKHKKTCIFIVYREDREAINVTFDE